MASKLDPHRSKIIELRKARRTWREIAEALKEEGVAVDVSLVYRWFRADRKRQAKINSELRPYQPPPFATVADPIRTAADAAAVLAAREAGGEAARQRQETMEEMSARDAEAARQPKKYNLKIIQPKPKTHEQSKE
jgi:hypothetical protein